VTVAVQAPVGFVHGLVPLPASTFGVLMHVLYVSVHACWTLMSVALVPMAATAVAADTPANLQSSSCAGALVATN
jgi:hypothetical protein